MESGLFYGLRRHGRRPRPADDATSSAATRLCIATGGLATLIAPETTLIDHVDVDLTLTGSRIVWERNGRLRSASIGHFGLLPGDRNLPVSEERRPPDSRRRAVVRPGRRAGRPTACRSRSRSAGIDRYFERYYRKGPAAPAGAHRLLRGRRARCVRRMAARSGPAGRRRVPPAVPRGAATIRVVALGTCAPSADECPSHGPARASRPTTVLDRLSGELDGARAAGRRRARFGARGARASHGWPGCRAGEDGAGHAGRTTSRGDSSEKQSEELRPFRDRMSAEAYERARDAAINRLVRERFQLPTLEPSA